MIIAALQELVPKRRLRHTEALALAELHAHKLRTALGVHTPAITTATLESIPGILVEEVAGLRVSGATQRVKNLWIVIINANEPRTRRRFTLAHEIKHILDHEAVSHLHGQGTTTPSWNPEQICDYFAACLLMPRPHIKRTYATTSQNETALANIFDVSRHAIGTRLQQIGLTEPTRRRHYTPNVIPLSTTTGSRREST